MNYFIFLLFLILPTSINAQKKKDVTSYNDADLERLYEQWEDNDDEQLEEDELPQHKRKPPAINLADNKGRSPEEMMMMSKKGQTLMMFVGVVNPDQPNEKKIRSFTEKYTDLWQSMLFNNHVEAQVFIIDENRAIFMFKEGSQAFEANNFLIKQPQVSEVTLEGQQFRGPAFQKEEL